MRRPGISLAVLAALAREPLFVRPREGLGDACRVAVAARVILRCIRPIMPADVDTKSTFFVIVMLLVATCAWNAALRGQLFQRLPLSGSRSRLRKLVSERVARSCGTKG